MRFVDLLNDNRMLFSMKLSGMNFRHEWNSWCVYSMDNTIDKEINMAA